MSTIAPSSASSCAPESESWLPVDEHELRARVQDAAGELGLQRRAAVGEVADEEQRRRRGRRAAAPAAPSEVVVQVRGDGDLRAPAQRRALARRRPRAGRGRRAGRRAPRRARRRAPRPTRPRAARAGCPGRGRSTAGAPRSPRGGSSTMMATPSASAVAPADSAPSRSGRPMPRGGRGRPAARAPARCRPPRPRGCAGRTRWRRVASRLTRARTRGVPAPSRATETAASRSMRWTSTRRRTGTRTPPKRTPQSTSGT